jgi:hypothetical protein
MPNVYENIMASLLPEQQRTAQEGQLKEQQTMAGVQSALQPIQQAAVSEMVLPSALGQEQKTYQTRRQYMEYDPKDTFTMQLAKESGHPVWSKWGALAEQAYLSGDPDLIKQANQIRMKNVPAKTDLYNFVMMRRQGEAQKVKTGTEKEHPEIKRLFDLYEKNVNSKVDMIEKSQGWKGNDLANSLRTTAEDIWGVFKKATPDEQYNIKNAARPTMMMNALSTQLEQGNIFGGGDKKTSKTFENYVKNAMNQKFLAQAQAVNKIKDPVEKQLATTSLMLKLWKDKNNPKSYQDNLGDAILLSSMRKANGATWNDVEGGEANRERLAIDFGIKAATAFNAKTGKRMEEVLTDTATKQANEIKGMVKPSIWQSGAEAAAKEPGMKNALEARVGAMVQTAKGSLPWVDTIFDINDANYLKTLQNVYKNQASIFVTNPRYKQKYDALLEEMQSPQ